MCVMLIAVELGCGDPPVFAVEINSCWQCPQQAAHLTSQPASQEGRSGQVRFDVAFRNPAGKVKSHLALALGKVFFLYIIYNVCVCVRRKVAALARLPLGALLLGNF